MPYPGDYPDEVTNDSHLSVPQLNPEYRSTLNLHVTSCRYVLLRKVLEKDMKTVIFVPEKGPVRDGKNVVSISEQRISKKMGILGE